MGGKDGTELIEVPFQQIQLTTFVIQQFKFAIEMVIDKGICFDPLRSCLDFPIQHILIDVNGLHGTDKILNPYHQMGIAGEDELGRHGEDAFVKDIVLESHEIGVQLRLKYLAPLQDSLGHGSTQMSITYRFHLRLRQKDVAFCGEDLLQQSGIRLHILGQEDLPKGIEDGLWDGSEVVQFPFPKQFTQNQGHCLMSHPSLHIRTSPLIHFRLGAQLFLAWHRE